ncbi:hypothetical protein KEU06_09740 [Pseudaminobacter sp. 19-2017]|uniref:Uncharacterized protein n=1 Tax=Pseudaminobacter soli (ex Zhang et al. 2022) TaxID=2831468 RepID=A0A942I2K8_9HYPH|nr:hypothetical protein [Pseudaminobacter soli]MBS3648888.1 hypothetical protein [Pseudaminobacter soli]
MTTVQVVAGSAIFGTCLFSVAVSLAGLPPTTAGECFAAIGSGIIGWCVYRSAT